MRRAQHPRYQVLLPPWRSGRKGLTNSEQVRLTRKFTSDFLVITDIIFNTNEYNLPLLVLVYITNILRSFPITYIYIISESTEAFLFINEYIRDLFFYNNYKGLVVLLSDFTAGLTVVIVSERKITLSEVGIQVVYELLARLDNLGSSYFLQLYN